MKQFSFRENELYCEEVPVRELTEEFGTPLYVYSRTELLDNFRSLDSLLQGTDHVTCYALKANSNPALLKSLADDGAGADVVSAGELSLALQAGFSPDKIVFAGVGKREDEIEYALRERIHCLNAESVQELQLISLVALRLQTGAPVALRINPNIDADSHPYISTGLKQHKFGIDGEKALETFQFAASLPNLEVKGVHTHIGSQIRKSEPFLAAADFLADLVKRLRESGILITQLDIGGGFGVGYENALEHEGLPRNEQGDPNAPDAPEILRAMLPTLQQTGCSLWVEPGRSIVASAGILLTRVLYTKEQGPKKFVIVDAGMNDLLRPSLYNAYHQIVPARIETYEHEPVDIVGPVCETGDFFARDRLLSKVKQRDILAIMTAGAYGFVNVSNYNGRLHPAEVLVNGDRVRVVRQRQTLEELLK
ncbi:MAG: diaminopimelate decarboxylase [Ignavibacteriales bacterium]|nr:diaminopimelate decarboxylase [Ignavibacteriales bacterium]